MTGRYVELLFIQHHMLSCRGRLSGTVRCVPGKGGRGVQHTTIGVTDKAKKTVGTWCRG
jgi:hypothetical protein